MKENIERIIKQQLENYELPYDGGAWEQFSKRLDGTPSTPFYRKWWFAASIGTVLVSSATYFALTSTESTDDRVAPKMEQVASTHQETSQSTDVKSGQNQSGSTSVTLVGGDDLEPEIDPIPLQEEAIPTFENFPLIELVSTPETIGAEPELRPRFVKLTLPSAICLNETFTIENPNDELVTVTYPNGRTKLIQPKQSAEIKSSKSGTIQVETGRSTESITVNEPASSLSISMVEQTMLYENGIPTLKFEVSGTDQPVTWESAVKSTTTDKGHFIVHPYTEREVLVTVTSTDINGCPISESQSVTLNEPYKLIAQNGINTSSSDPRNSQFMPLALTIRDTPFELSIIDPNTTATIYKTSDASQPWNGVDSRTGQLVAVGTTWIWKVVMKNPQLGEPSEYSGLITNRGK